MPFRIGPGRGRGSGAGRGGAKGGAAAFGVERERGEGGGGGGDAHAGESVDVLVADADGEGVGAEAGAGAGLAGALGEVVVEAMFDEFAVGCFEAAFEVGDGAFELPAEGGDVGLGGAVDEDAAGVFREGGERR